MRKLVVFSFILLLAITGCIDSLNGDSAPEPEGMNVTVELGLDQEDPRIADFQQLRSNLSAQMENGTITQDEMNSILVEEQELLIRDLLNDSEDDVVEYVNDSESLAVEDELLVISQLRGNTQGKLLLVSGNSQEMLGLLDIESVESIRSEQHFHDVEQRQQGGGLGMAP